MSSDRRWMYNRLTNGRLNQEFVDGLGQFIDFAISQPTWMDGNKIKCPCNGRKCQNRVYHDSETVKFHVAKNGFVPDYYVWDCHGETNVDVNNSQNTVFSQEFDNAYDLTAYHSMVFDAAGPQFTPQQFEEPPNPEAKQFYDMLSAADKELWPGCKKHTLLSFVARVMTMKSENHMTVKNFDQMVQYMKEILPDDNVVTDNFYSAKKLLRGLGLPVEKIDYCTNRCMIYWGEDSELNICKFCEHPCYKRTYREGGKRHKTNISCKKMYYFPLTDRLKRLYASNATAKEMRWHAEHEVEDGVMIHCSDSPAWKHFNQTHPEFATEIWNVRLGLCTDGFQPFGQSGRQYSSWPVIVTPYNLPPWLCMKEQYMFLTVLVPGPENPKEKLDVFLQPLITELKHLWETGVLAYDISKKQNFQMRAALMWTISDFPAYSMLSGWSTAGRMACPYCMDDSDAFSLSKSRKQSWFDNHRKFLPLDHPFRKNKTSFIKNKMVVKVAPPVKSGIEILREIQSLGIKRVIELDAEETNRAKCKHSSWKKRSIFWDLPYWSTNLIRHNLDVMHIEKNVFDNIFNTVMEVEGKTNDTFKSREELNEYCRRPELAQNVSTGKYPKACYTLDKCGKQALCEWVKKLQFPDGYASNMAKCVDMKKHKLYGMKSHDCHVFMQRLIPIAFRELLPSNVWKALTELSLFFKELTTTVIRNEDMVRLEKQIPVILCKLERIFPLSFFNSMEHLPIHLVYEAKMTGPVQYRWMYPFERYLRKLKNNVNNKAKVEGSICNAYLVEEATSFCSYYFEDHVSTRHRQVPRNEDNSIQREKCDEHEGNLSIFKYPGRPLGKGKSRVLRDEEYKAARSYILLNCSEVKPFTRIYIDALKQGQPNITEIEVDNKLENEFPYWFETYAHNPSNNISNKFIKDLAKGPLPTVLSYHGYFVNGYRFHTLQHGSMRRTINSGVCIKGSNLCVEEGDYYGQLVEVIELEYPALPIKRIVLFKCDWFDPTPNLGTKVHNEYKLVEVNNKRRFNKYEPFVLAVQANQVYFCSYPSLRRDKCDWWAVFKIKARAIVDVVLPSETNDQSPFQEVDIEVHHHSQIHLDEDPISLNDPNGIFINLEGDTIEQEDETLIESDEEDSDSTEEEELYDESTNSSNSD